MRRLSIVPLVLSVLVPAALRAQTDSRSAIVGDWHGTSTCVDKVANPACNDEVVIYEVRALTQSRDSITLRADKVVNGVRDFMGEFHFGRDSAGAWVSEFRTPRVQLRIRILVNGSSMSGEVVDVPTGRVGRRMALRRVVP